MLLWVLQDVINKQLDARSFRCGCKCLVCCDWVPVDGANATSSGGEPLNGTSAVSYQCYQATGEKPCSPYAKCQARRSGSTSNAFAACAFLAHLAWRLGMTPAARASVRKAMAGALWVSCSQAGQCSVLVVRPAW